MRSSASSSSPRHVVVIVSIHTLTIIIMIIIIVITIVTFAIISLFTIIISIHCSDIIKTKRCPSTAQHTGSRQPLQQLPQRAFASLLLARSHALYTAMTVKHPTRSEGH